MFILSSLGMGQLEASYRLKTQFGHRHAEMICHRSSFPLSARNGDCLKPQIAHGTQSAPVAMPHCASPGLALATEFLTILTVDILNKLLAAQRHTVREIPYPTTQKLATRQLPTLVEDLLYGFN